jgi:cytochrome b subunit of formate dehydrogenase
MPLRSRPLRRSPLGPLAALALLGSLATAPLPARAADAGKPPAAPDNDDCLGCHDDAGLRGIGPDGKERSLQVEAAKFAASIHGGERCTACHDDITEVPHPDHFRAKAVECSRCHRLETQIYLGSDHGKAVHQGVPEAASCKDCHGKSHTLLGSRDPASPVNRANVPATCARCHGNVAEMKKRGLRQQDPVGTYLASVHGLALSQRRVTTAAVCTDCHGSHDLHRSTNPESKLYWKAVPQTCGKCHENVQRTYLRSIHGQALAKGVRDTPVCTDCHGEHTIAAVRSPGSRVSPGNVPNTCGQCHAAERIVTQYQLPPDVVSTYVESFHGLALKGGNPTVASCASCHGAHDILPASDPLSSVNPKVLPQTCGKCHPGIGTRMSAEFFKIHAPAGRHDDKHWLVNLVTTIYLALIILVIGGMAAFVTLDYAKKARDHARAVRESGAGEERLPRALRLQHLVLMILFGGLVYTGFVHRYPEAFFSWPFRALQDGNALRGLLHRIFGWAFVGFFGLHLGALLGTASGRAYARALWLRAHDLTDALAQARWNAGLGGAEPPHRRWNYAEKAEYWALVWGSVVMAVTGVMLVFTETVLRSLPKVWLDVAQVVHFYEAVLATLAILVWHLYWVVFDPREYPMNPAWLIGKKAGHGQAEARPEPEPESKPESKPEPAQPQGKGGPPSP